MLKIVKNIYQYFDIFYELIYNSLVKFQWNIYKAVVEAHVDRIEIHFKLIITSTQSHTLKLLHMVIHCSSIKKIQYKLITNSLIHYIRMISPDSNLSLLGCQGSKWKKNSQQQFFCSIQYAADLNQYHTDVSYISSVLCVRKLGPNWKISPLS